MNKKSIIKVRELSRNLLSVVENLQAYEDPDVVVVLCDGGCPARSSVGIEGAYLGFDWEAGRLNLMPVEPLVKKPKRPAKPKE